MAEIKHQFDGYIMLECSNILERWFLIIRQQFENRHPAPKEVRRYRSIGEIEGVLFDAGQ